MSLTMQCTAGPPVRYPSYTIHATFTVTIDSKLVDSQSHTVDQSVTPSFWSINYAGQIIGVHLRCSNAANGWFRGDSDMQEVSPVRSAVITLPLTYCPPPPFLPGAPQENGGKCKATL